MKKKKTAKYIFTSCLCCLICAMMIVMSSPTLIFATSLQETEESSDSDTESSDKDDEEYRQQISDLQDKQNEIKKQQDELDGIISGIKDDKKKQQALANSFDAQIEITKAEIALCEEKIAFQKKLIAQKTNEISSKEKNIDESMELFRERIRAIYMTGGYSDTTNSLIMLLSSRSVSEFLTRAEFLSRIAKHDEKMVTELRDELAELEDEKAVLEDEKAELEAENTALQAKQEELSKSLQQAKASIQDLSAMQKEYEENYEELSAASKAIQDEIADIYKNLNTSSADYIGGEMMWPVPGYSKISCYYGWRFNNTDFHTGIDITGSGVHGAPVVAANTGTVIYTKYCPYNGYSYGYGTYIIVDHGGGITTLYGHLSAITVNVGDIVVMGEQIGNVGNTGWSTGAHLHFEVRVNGSAVDPIGYVT
ncbi:MAG: murein hydrolase activator EnvC family protein [Oscillospiraceae bacterium]